MQKWSDMDNGISAEQPTPSPVPNTSIRFEFPHRPNLPNNDAPIQPQRTWTIDSTASSSSSSYDKSESYGERSVWIMAPSFIATFFSVICTFFHVRATAIGGYIVDHSSWDGKGHHYDRHALVSLNSTELALMIVSLVCTITICLLLVAKLRMQQELASIYCVLLGVVHVFCTLTAFLLFYIRTLDIINASSASVYSRGFYSCIMSWALMLAALFGFIIDWLLGSPTTGKLFTITAGLFLPSLMYCFTLIVGALCFMWIEQFEYNQALMFCATALTTIGYGDVTPTTNAGRLFFLVYASIGICVVGYFFLSFRAVMISGSTANHLIKVNLMRMESLHDYTRQRRRRHNLRQMLSRQPSLQQSYRWNNSRDRPWTDTDSYRVTAADTMAEENWTSKLSRRLSSSGASTFSNYTLANFLKDETRQIWVHVVMRSGAWRMAILFTVSWFGGSALFCVLEEDWSYLDALYFTFATQLTIGFGDLVPQKALAQEFWFIYIIISIAVAAYFISLFGDVLAQKLVNMDQGPGLDDEDNDESSVTSEPGGNGHPSEADIYRYNVLGGMMAEEAANRRDTTVMNDGMTETSGALQPNRIENKVLGQQEERAERGENRVPMGGDDLSLSTSAQQCRQKQFVQQQPLRYRTHSLPVFLNRQQGYGSIPPAPAERESRMHLPNRRSLQWLKSSRYLPIAVVSNRHRS